MHFLLFLLLSLIRVVIVSSIVATVFVVFINFRLTFLKRRDRLSIQEWMIAAAMWQLFNLPAAEPPVMFYFVLRPQRSLIGFVCLLSSPGNSRRSLFGGLFSVSEPRNGGQIVWSDWHRWAGEAGPKGKWPFQTLVKLVFILRLVFFSGRGVCPMQGRRPIGDYRRSNQIFTAAGATRAGRGAEGRYLAPRRLQL